MFMTVCNLSPRRLPKIYDKQSLTLYWLSFSGCGRVYASVHFDHKHSQYIENKLWCTNVNILWLSVVYLSAIINMKPNTQNWRLAPKGLAKHGETRWLMHTGQGSASQESGGWVIGWVWNWTDPFFWSKPKPLVGYPDLLLILLISYTTLHISQCHSGLMLTTHHLIRNESPEYERIVTWLVIGNMVSCW